MRFGLITLTLVFCGAASAAPTGDPLKSPECVAAMGLLEAQEAASIARSKASDPRDSAPSQRDSTSQSGREAARRNAAHHCLGANPDSPPPPRPAQPPSGSMPARVAPSGSFRPLPMPAPAQAPIQIPYPKSASFCDPTGCLLNDGTRLQRVGESQLVGPKGLCTLLGSMLFCP